MIKLSVFHSSFLQYTYSTSGEDLSGMRLTFINSLPYDNRLKSNFFERFFIGVYAWY